MVSSGLNGGADARPAAWLVCRAGARLCALPLSDVVETMRPLPVEPFVGMPVWVDGLCIVRGAPVPVVDAGRLLGDAAAPRRRLVTLAVGGRMVALSVGEVLGVEAFADPGKTALPPLLREVVGDAIEAIRVLDGELLLVLRGARLVPDAVFDAIAAAGPAL